MKHHRGGRVWSGHPAAEATRGRNEHSGESREERGRGRGKSCPASAGSGQGLVVLQHHPRHGAGGKMHHHGRTEGCSAPQRLTQARRARSGAARPQPPSASGRRFAAGLREPPLPAAPFAAGPPPLRGFSFGRRRPGRAAGAEQQCTHAHAPTPVGAFRFAAGAGSRSPRPLPLPQSQSQSQSRRRGGGGSASPPPPRVSGPPASRRRLPGVAKPTDTCQVNGTPSPPRPALNVRPCRRRDGPAGGCRGKVALDRGKETNKQKKNQINLSRRQPGSAF